jgi:peptidoglycan/LPS O-acetylase OafA/YrhL
LAAVPDAVARLVPRPPPASQPQPASQPEIRPTGPAAGTRLAWLDALRGIAALCVVFDHPTFVLVLLVCCGLTHRFIEAPMQRLGRRVARRFDVRFGSDSVAGQPGGTP